jgi:PAS domain S-box-containing protein
MIGKAIVELHPLEQRMFAEMLIEDMLAGICDVCPIPLQTADGDLIQVETRVMLGRWSGKDVLFGVSKDVTDLKLSNEKFTTIFRFAPIAISITEVDSGKVLEVNDAWVKLTGHDRDETIGKTVYDLHLYRSKAERDALITTLESTGFLANYPISMLSRQGKNIVGQFSAARILINGITCWITAMVDITDQVKLEQAIETFRNTVLREARDEITKSLREGQFVKE